MADKHFYEHFKGVVDTFQLANSDGSIDAGEAFQLAKAVIQAGLHFEEALFGDEDHFSQLASDAERVYREYIEPKDIAAVPNWLEAPAEKVLIGQIRPGLEALRLVGGG